MKKHVLSASDGTNRTFSTSNVAWISTQYPVPFITRKLDVRDGNCNGLQTFAGHWSLFHWRESFRARLAMRIVGRNGLTTTGFSILWLCSTFVILLDRCNEGKEIRKNRELGLSKDF